MSAPTAKILLAVTHQAVLVKVIGKGSFSISVDLKTAIEELAKMGHRQFVFEVSECPLMDSTFMGVLAGFAMDRQAQEGAPACPAVKLVNPVQRVADLLDNLGVAHLFEIVHGPIPAADAPMTPAASLQPSKTEVTKTCLQAHETLMALNPQNVAKFKDVARFLAEDIRRLEAEKLPKPPAQP